MRSATASSPETVLQGRRELSPRTITFLLLAITAAGAVLRFLYLARKSFWLDEGVSVMLARLDLANLLHILWRREANMALYYGLLRMWLHFGGGDYFVRSLSAVISVAAIPVIYLLGKRLFGSPTGMLTAALFSVHAWQVRYAQEARSYSLYVLLSLLSCLFFLAAIEKPTRRCWNAYIACSVLAIYGHFFALLVVMAQWASFYFLRHDQAVSAGFRRSLKTIGLLFLPQAVFIVSRGTGPLSWISRPGLQDLHRFLLHLAGNGGDALLLLYAVCCAVALAAGGWSARNLSVASWRYLFLLSWLFVPVAITLAFSLIRPVFLPRYMLTCVAPLLLLAAAGLARLRPRWLAGILVIAMLALSVRGTWAYYRADFDLGREDWRAATQYLLQSARPGDGILFHSAQARMPFEYYSGGQPPRHELRVIFPDYGKEGRLSYMDFLANARNAPLAEIPRRYPRVWLVLAHNQLKDGEPDPTTATLQRSLAKNYRVAEQRNFAGNLQVQLYARNWPAAQQASGQR
ncbi:MAG TPA: glycosyltransferase family 39 protein [Terriglobales bacterium]|nr:glycosyltransferase family 39 protein [Terriglobales bacterium]